MSGTDEIPLRLWRLMDAHLNDTIAEDEMRELESLVMASDSAGRAFLDYVRLHAELHLLAAARRAGDDAIERQRRRSAPAAAASPLPKAAPLSTLGFLKGLSRIGNESPSAAALTWLVMALLSSGMVITIFFCILLVVRGAGGKANIDGPRVAGHAEQGARDTERQTVVKKQDIASPNAELSAPSPPLPASATVARLVHTYDCRWAIGSHSPRMGDDLEPGRKLVLTSGLAEILFQSGVRAVLQGPATMEVASKTNAFLRQGRLTVMVVDPDTRGFEVCAPGMKYTDLGTEFGVFVAKDGTQEMHVFRGRVLAEEVKPVISNSKPEISNPSSPAVSRPSTLVLTAHQAIRIAAPGKLIEKVVADEKQFVRTAQFASIVREQSPQFKRWKNANDRLRRDPDLVAYYDFQTDEADSAVLRNRAATGSKLDGRIEGAKWCEGHFPGKMALRFSGRADRVRVDIPGHFAVLTIAARVRLDDMRSAFASILDSDGWHIAVGQCHFQIQDNGRLELAPCFVTTHSPAERFNNTRSGKALIGAGDRGAWIQLAAVYDSRKGTLTYYKNGQSYGTVRPSIPLVPLLFGPSEIGHWDPVPGDGVGDKYFVGSIDELLLVARALSAEELKSLCEAGRP